MKFAAMVLGVAHPQKLAWLTPTLESINNSQRFQFDKRVLAIDEFRRHRFPSALFKKYRGMGWSIVKDSHMSRPKSMKHALTLMDEDVVFYHEDDVLVNLPAREHIEQIFNHTLPDGRTCGMCSLTLGGTKAWFSGFEGVGDLANIEQNTLFKWDDYLAFQRIEETKDEHFFEFPGLFIKQDILDQCLRHAMLHCKGRQIEKALTVAWFDLGLDKKFFKCSIAKNNIVDIMQGDFKTVFKDCRLLHNLDPNQGNSMYFGNHHV